MSNRTLVTGAAGPVGGVGRAIAELLLQQGKPVRATVRNEDERAQALRDKGAEVVLGNLFDLDSMHRAIAACETMYVGMSVSDEYLAATVNAAAVAKHHGVKAFINMSQMTLSQMSITETTATPQDKLHWLAEQTLNWSGLPGDTRATDRPSRRILPHSHRRFSPAIQSDQTAVWRRQDVAGRSGRRRTSGRRAARNPQARLGKIYHLTGPRSDNMRFFAQEYSNALGRTITFQDIPVEPWREGLLERGLPIHLVNHLATMADLHRSGRYDRMSDDVLTLTGQTPLSVQEFVKKNSTKFTEPAPAV